MAERQFKFVSPGVSVKEIDQSQLPDESNRRGPLIIGRTERGPAMVPTLIKSFSEYVEIFGNPVPGNRGGDVWRQGNYTSPMYATYAAQAYLETNTPVNILRLIGEEHDDAPASGKAGWTGATLAASTGGGAYGLFVFDSGSFDTPITGTLAAVWYTSTANTRICLSGNLRGTTNIPTSSLGTVIASTSGPTFTAQVYESANTTPTKTYIFNFDRTSDKFIRKVFNADPTVTNTSLYASSTDQYEQYWLGESFEDQFGTGKQVSGSSCLGIILPLDNDSNSSDISNWKIPSQASRSGWIIGQDLGPATSYVYNNAQKLFRFHSRCKGEWNQKNIKISIDNIKVSRNSFNEYGTFSVVVRKIDDTDTNPEIIERFDNLSLNSADSNYIARVIGTRFYEWNEDQKILRDHGEYPNASKFIYVEMDSEVEGGGLNAQYLPAGFLGPLRYKGFTMTSGSQVINPLASPYDDVEFTDHILSIATAKIPFLRTQANDADLAFEAGTVPMTASIVYPAIGLRSSSIDSTLPRPTAAYFGFETRRSPTSPSKLYNYVVNDLLLAKPSGINSFDPGTVTEYQAVFTLDDLSGSGYTDGDTVVNLAWVSGSRTSGRSVTAVGVGLSTTAISSSFTDLLNAGWNRFTLPLYGGFDGFDITEKDPLRNTLLTNQTALSSYEYNTLDRALNIAADRENIEFNIAVMPGITNPNLTSKLIDVCESRGDSLAIIDLEGDYVPKHEGLSTSTESERIGSVDTTITNLKNRGLNSSYGCTYFPWVLAKDTTTTGQTLWLPPSVAALGVMGNSDANSELWFAPAGFNRGNLTNGSAGIPILGVRQRLRTLERDKLYDANINSIVSFPSEGIVVFGQKTLQVTASALDRINVRRLLLYLKQEIAFAADQILFDQNVQATWNRFLSVVNPLLSSVKARFGLDDYKVILDETTTTPDLVDRNIMYAKIFVKPSKSIEYIGIDFNLSPSGASFAV